MTEVSSDSQKISRRLLFKKAVATFAGVGALQNIGNAADKLAAIGTAINPSEGQVRANRQKITDEKLRERGVPQQYVDLVQETVDRFNKRYLAKVEILPFDGTSLTDVYNLATQYQEPRGVNFPEKLAVLQNTKWGEKARDVEQAIDAKLQKISESSRDMKLTNFLQTTL